MTDNTKEYNIIVNEPLTDFERASLTASASQLGIKLIYMAETITSITIHDSHNPELSVIATWFDQIGALEDIFCIQEVNNYYTGAITPEIKELLKL